MFSRGCIFFCRLQFNGIAPMGKCDSATYRESAMNYSAITQYVVATSQVAGAIVTMKRAALIVHLTYGGRDRRDGDRFLNLTPTWMVGNYAALLERDAISRCSKMLLCRNARCLSLSGFVQTLAFSQDTHFRRKRKLTSLLPRDTQFRMSAPVGSSSMESFCK